MEEQKKQETSSRGLGAGLGVDLNLKFGQIRELVHTLNSALRETAGTVTGIISDLANKLKEFGPNFKREAQRGGYEEEYNSLVSNLREAASRGEAKARNLLTEMGESLEHAGHSMKEKGKKKPH